MKTYKMCRLLLFVMPLFICGNCKHEEEGPSFIVKNESDKAIVIQFSFYEPISQDTCCMKPGSSYEHSTLVHSKVVSPYSEKHFEEIGELMINSHQTDTLYIGAFYLDDIDSMSCEEFEQLFPIKKEWKTTSTQMEEIGWVLKF